MPRRDPDGSRSDPRASLEAFDHTPPVDGVVAVVAAITSVVPVVGGALAAGLTEWRQYTAMSRLILILQCFAEAIEEVRDEVDPDFAASSEFRQAVDWTIESATQARNAEKRRYYAASLAMTATAARPDRDERALMLDTLDRLQPAHLALLAAVATDPEPPAGPRAYLVVDTPANARLRAALPGASEELLDRCWEDLAALRLIDSASILTSDQEGTVSAHIPDSVVLPFGRRFLDFVTGPE